MAGRIIVLPDDLTNKIAAGEVIERPASIVKELLENALDAKATDITIVLAQGGCGSIKVIDNGEGIEPEDAALAFSRYATSKIYNFDDLYNVLTFGFRGEALPSIASVSRVELITKKVNYAAGMRVIAESGHIREIMETGCPEGTSVSVTNIFETVPVRRKFLKRELTEQGHCMDIVSRLALSHPGVRLKLIANGREILNVPAAKDAGERLALVLGTDFLDQMLFFSGENEGITLRGFASLPSLTRANARHIYCFVNKRFIRDHQLNHAVMAAYRRLIEGKRYPACVLFIDLPTQDVDVNVHPAKLEVRFRNPRSVYNLVVDTLSAALRDIQPATSISHRIEDNVNYISGDHDFRTGVKEALKRYSLSSGSGGRFQARPILSPFKSSRIVESSLFIQGRDARQIDRRFSDLDFVGQVNSSYLIFTSDDGIILIDQHAAHERILFEKLKKVASGNEGRQTSQALLLPEVINLTQRHLLSLNDFLPVLADIGFEIEPFGSDAVILRATPANLPFIDSKEFIIDFLEEFADKQWATLNERKEKVFAFLACKGAVKAGQSLSPVEVMALCRDLDLTPNISTCPHGRPVWVSFSLHDLERMFKRR